MLPKKHRLSREKEIKLLLKTGRLVKGNLADLKYLKNDFLWPRFLFLISIKVAKLATERNKIRRHLAEIIGRHQRDLKPYDFAIITKKGIAGKKQTEIADDISGLFGKIK